MKKHLLFVAYRMTVGGVSKSLISLLSQLNYQKYEVDLLLFSKEGPLLGLIPDEVNVFEATGVMKYFWKPWGESVKEMAKHFQFRMLAHKFASLVESRMKKGKGGSSQFYWKRIYRQIPCLEKKYDAAIAFVDWYPLYYVADKVNARVKIAWNHSNYISMNRNPNVERAYFKKMNAIMCVSPTCRDVLAHVFPECSERILVMYNIVSKRLIDKMANEPVDFKDDENFDGIRILTMGRLSREKGIDMAILACERLLRDGLKVKWYVLGDGPEYRHLCRMVKQHRVSGNFIFLGTCINPYPYLKRSDIYVQPSRYEGKSVAIDEAKILCKPIVVTNFSTAQDQISNGKNGLIVSMDADGIYTGIKSLIENPELRERISKTLANEDITNEHEIQKLYNVIEG